MVPTIKKPKAGTPARVAGKNPTQARVAKRRAHVAPPKPKPALTAAQPKKATTARSSKTEKIFDLLKRPGGVTLKQLAKASGWQPHSVRGFLSGTLRKKRGIPIESTKTEGGERSYHIAE